MEAFSEEVLSSMIVCAAPNPTRLWQVVSAYEAGLNVFKSAYALGVKKWSDSEARDGLSVVDKSQRLRRNWRSSAEEDERSLGEDPASLSLSVSLKACEL